MVMRQLCKAFGGKYTEGDGCDITKSLLRSSMKYASLYILVVMFITIFISRILLTFSNPDWLLNLPISDGEVSIVQLEFHHFYYGIFIIIPVSIYGLFANLTDGKVWVMMTLYGIGFGIIADELLLIVELATTGTVSEYGSMLYAMIGALLLFALIILGERVGRSQSKGKLETESVR